MKIIGPETENSQLGGAYIGLILHSNTRKSLKRTNKYSSVHCLLSYFEIFNNIYSAYEIKK